MTRVGDSLSGYGKVDSLNSMAIGTLYVLLPAGLGVVGLVAHHRKA